MMMDDNDDDDDDDDADADDDDDWCHCTVRMKTKFIIRRMPGVNYHMHILKWSQRLGHFRSKVPPHLRCKLGGKD